MPSDHPALPVTPEALADTAFACMAAGAGAFHVHVRDREGGHSLDAGLYRESLAAIRDRVGDGPHLQVSTEQIGRYGPDEQMDLVGGLRPDGASIALREILPPDRNDMGWRRHVADFLAWMDDEGIARQIIIYHPDELGRLARLRAEGIVPPAPGSLLLVLGAYGGRDYGTPAAMPRFLNNIESEDSWWIAAFGPHEGRCALTAALLGGHTRLGFENNVSLMSGQRAPDNAALIGEFAGALEAAGMPRLGVDETGQVLREPDAWSATVSAGR